MPRDPRDPAPTVRGRLRRLLRAVRRIDARYAETFERLHLLDRPWEQQLLHWAHDGDDWHLHGHLVPPADGRRRSVTPAGWCACRRLERAERAWSED